MRSSKFQDLRVDARCVWIIRLQTGGRSLISPLWPNCRNTWHGVVRLVTRPFTPSSLLPHRPGVSYTDP